MGLRQELVKAMLKGEFKKFASSLSKEEFNSITHDMLLVAAKDARAIRAAEAKKAGTGIYAKSRVFEDAYKSPPKYKGSLLPKELKEKIARIFEGEPTSTKELSLLREETSSGRLKIIERPTEEAKKLLKEQPTKYSPVAESRGTAKLWTKEKEDEYTQLKYTIPQSEEQKIASKERIVKEKKARAQFEDAYKLWQAKVARSPQAIKKWNSLYKSVNKGHEPKVDRVQKMFIQEYNSWKANPKEYYEKGNFNDRIMATHFETLSPTRQGIK